MKIVTDSAADLLPGEIADLDITVAPLFIQFPDGERRSEELTPDEFYDRLRAMAPEVPTTAMPAVGTFTDIFRRLGEATERILSLHISSGLSGTFGTATLGARESGVEVELVDTQTLSGGQRFQVLAAALMARAGLGLKAISTRLEQIRSATEVIYTLETLEYLQRGGRIGRVQALAGSLLKLKPVIKVDKKDGKYSTVGTARTLKRSYEVMIDYLKKVYTPDTPLWLSVMHGQFTDQAEQFAELLRANFNVARLEVLRISPVLGVHTGPGIVGVTAVPSALLIDLY